MAKYPFPLQIYISARQLEELDEVLAVLNEPRSGFVREAVMQKLHEIKHGYMVKLKKDE